MCLVTAVIGAPSSAQLTDSLGSLEVVLPADVLARLDAVSPTSLGFPHDFQRWDAARAIVYGRTYEAIAR